EEHGGEVPGSMDELVALAGVGRKTANVVLGNAFGIPGIVVDTHVQRLSRRLGISKQTTPEKIELDLMPIIPKRHWVALGHRLIQHGRQVCTARNPDCAGCVLASFCPKIGVNGSAKKGAKDKSD